MTEAEIRAVALALVSSAGRPGGNHELLIAVQYLLGVCDETLRRQGLELRLERRLPPDLDPPQDFVAYAPEALTPPG